MNDLPNELLVGQHGIELRQHYAGHFFAALSLQLLPLFPQLLFGTVELGESFLLGLEGSLEVFRIQALSGILHPALSSPQGFHALLLTLGLALLLATLLLLALLLLALLQLSVSSLENLVSVPATVTAPLGCSAVFASLFLKFRWRA